MRVCARRCSRRGGASVGVLERFTRHYMLSKQRTWRVTHGLVAMSSNGSALRAQLKAQRRTAVQATKAETELALKLGRGAIDMLLDSVAVMTKQDGENVVQQATEAGAIVASRQVRNRNVDDTDGDNIGAPAPGDSEADDGTAPSARSHLPVGAYLVVLMTPDHGLEVEQVQGTIIKEAVKGSRPLRVVSATSRGLAVIGAGINTGDFIINVERMQRAKSGVVHGGARYRALPMTVLCDGDAGGGRAGSTTGQYPLCLTLVPGKHLLAHGLPAVTRQLIGSAEQVTAATEAAEAEAEAALLAKQRTPKRAKGKENAGPATPAAGAVATPGNRTNGPAAPDTAPKKKKKMKNRNPALIVFYTSKTPPTQTTTNTVDGPEWSSAAGFGAASAPTTMHTHMYHGVSAGNNTAAGARRRGQAGA